MSEKELIRGFYEAFQRKDGKAMGDCYHDEATFSDPVFRDLEAWQARAMWSMLCERAKDLEISFSDVEVEGDHGSARWEAIYTFQKTGNRVHNKIRATFRFRDGKIIEHKDHFGFWRWCGMALGTTGTLLGWTPMVQNKVRKEAMTGLQMYIKRKRLGPPS